MVSIETILLFVAVSSILGLSGGIILLAKKTFAKRITFYLVGFAAGALLGVSFLDLLPEAMEIAGGENVLVYTLIGIMGFFLVEKFLMWHHHHTYKTTEFHSYSYLITVGDTIHNFIDGIIIAVSFAVSPALGIPTALAVILHEIPQEIGDFGILLHAKWRRKKILIVSLLTALSSVIGAVVAYYFLFPIEGFLTAAMAFAAGAFIYIAAADLMPESKNEKNPRKSLLQIALLILGILVIWASHALIHVP